MIFVYYLAKKKTTTAIWIMHKIRTLFLTHKIKRLARWCAQLRLRPSLYRSAIKLDFLISSDGNGVLIICRRNLFHLYPEPCSCTSAMSKTRDIFAHRFYNFSHLQQSSDDQSRHEFLVLFFKPAGGPNSATLVPDIFQVAVFFFVQGVVANTPFFTTSF